MAVTRPIARIAALFPVLIAGPFAGLVPADSPLRAAERALLIVAPEGFGAALSGYVEHKRAQLPVELHSLERILRESPGADDPERLKRFLYDAWKGRSSPAGSEAARTTSPAGDGAPAAAPSRPRDGTPDLYVLLVGDADVLPVRYMVLDRVTPAAFDYAFYPSDLYYADVARADGSFDDWNASKDGFHRAYYGEVRGEKNKDGPINHDRIDYIPEIAVGRWPVSTPEEVARLAEKSASYERALVSGTKPGARRAAFVAVGGWVDSRPLFDRLAAGLPAGWSIEKLYDPERRSGGRAGGRGGDRPGNRYAGRAGGPVPPPSADEVVKILNEGVGIVCHAGHGQDQAWERSFSLGDLARLTNADRLPIVISAGCSTARFATLPPYEPFVDAEGKEHRGTDAGEVFDAPPPPPEVYPKGRHNPRGLGEELLRRGPNGAVAYMGCNTGSQPCGLTLVEGFVAALGDLERSGGRGPARLGDAWNRAIAHYHQKERLDALVPTESWYPASIFFQGMKFMLFGDPSLLLPPAVPEAAPEAPRAGPEQARKGA